MLQAKNISPLQAFTQFTQKYGSFLKKRAVLFSLQFSADAADVEQEALVAAWEAATDSTWDPAEGASQITFIWRKVSWRFNDMAREMSRQKRSKETLLPTYAEEEESNTVFDCANGGFISAKVEIKDVFARVLGAAGEELDVERWSVVFTLLDAQERERLLDQSQVAMYDSGDSIPVGARMRADLEICSKSDLLRYTGVRDVRIVNSALEWIRDKFEEYHEA